MLDGETSPTIMMQYLGASSVLMKVFAEDTTYTITFRSGKTLEARLGDYLIEDPDNKDSYKVVSRDEFNEKYERVRAIVNS
jgi:hypothetical protein